MAKTVKIGPYSAYAIAVAAGYQGTEQEWLASLVGPQGAQGASVTGAQIDADGHLILTVHDPKTGTDTKIDAGSIDTTGAVQNVIAQIQQAGKDAVNLVSQSVQQAAGSASAAAASAGKAASSATQAGQSATEAAGSATAASNSASAAKESEKAAAKSAEEAKKSTPASTLDGMYTAMLDGTNTQKIFKLWWPFAVKQSENKYSCLERFAAMLDTAWGEKTYTVRNIHESVSGDASGTPLDDLADGRSAAPW